MKTLDDTMDALVWLGPRDMVQRAEPLPRLADGEVLVAVGAVGICGSELSGFLGHNSLRIPPLIMGHECAGRIVETTTGTLATGQQARVGTRVTFNPLVVCGTCDRCRAGRTNLCRRRQLVGAHRPGAFAQYVAVPARQCYALPDHLSLVAGSLAEPLACSIHAVAQAFVQPKQSLLVLGAGPIGLCAVAAARTQGVEQIIVSDVAPQRLAVAQRWGARTVINPREQDIVAVLQEHYPGGVDSVIDAVGATAVRQQAIQSVVPGGHVVLIGLHDEESMFPANYLVRQEIALIGSFAYTEADFAQAVELLVRGVVQPSADWLEERPLSDGPTAFAELVDGRAKAAKIVLIVAPPTDDVPEKENRDAH
jgi:2-desacetyl-2-hydroxyethyl bacteriochlorophyllide A dehydrogenase